MKILAAFLLLMPLFGGAVPALAQDGPMILFPQDPAPVAPPSAPAAPAQVLDLNSPLVLDPASPSATQVTLSAVPMPRFNPRHIAPPTAAAGASVTPLRIDTTLPLAQPEALAAERILRELAGSDLSLSVQSPSPPLLSAPAPIAEGATVLPALASTNLSPALPVSIEIGQTGQSGLPIDRAYGAFQRGYYLSAFSLAIPRAENGDIAAQTLLGLIYEGGYGVPRNFSEAVGWYQFAAASGSREAQFALGMMYLEGRGVERDRAVAADYLELAADGGKIAAKYNVALLYLEGQARPTDIDRATELFGEAAGAGNREAQYALAQLYAEGSVVPADEFAATSWFAEAAQLGHVPSQVEYAIRLFNGSGVTKSETAAAAWFRRAADLGDPIAQNRYARILATGRGTTMDTVEAAKFYFLSMSAGRQDGMLAEVVAGLTETQRQSAIAAAQRWPAN